MHAVTIWIEAKDRWLADDASATGSLRGALSALQAGSRVADTSARGDTLILWRFRCTREQAGYLLDRAQQLAQGYHGVDDHLEGVFLKAAQQISDAA